MVWVIYPRTHTAVEHLADGSIRLLNAGQALQTEMLPGFSLPISALFD